MLVGHDAQRPVAVLRLEVRLPQVGRLEDVAVGVDRTGEREPLRRVHGLRHARERTLSALARPDSTARGIPWTSTIPPEIQSTLDALDEFIEREIKPLEQADDNMRFFDHRREYARTDFENGGVPRARLGGAARARCAAAPTPRAGCATRSPRSTAATTPATSRWRSSASTSRRKGLGLHNDLQNESSIVGNFPTVLMMRDFGTDEQQRRVDARLPRRHPPARVRAHRAEPRLRRHLPRDHRRRATATSG